MTSFLLTSSAFSGSCTFKYDSDGYLVYFTYDAVMTTEMRHHLLRKLPLTMHGLEELVRGSKTAKLEELPEDLSFEAFWNAYGKKINRKRSEPLWNKMSEKDRLQCIQSLKPYVSYLYRTGFREKKDPENYLRDRLFETDWHKIR